MVSIQCFEHCGLGSNPGRTTILINNANQGLNFGVDSQEVTFTKL